MGGRIRGDETVDKTGLAQKTCKRCGTCCTKNPPALHKQDLDLINTKKISFTHLITYRKGKPLFDNVKNKVIRLGQEIIKLKTKPQNTSCIFYNKEKKSCEIYKFRPIECRKLKCWDTDEFLAFYNRDRIHRFSLIKKDSAMGEIIFEHEQKTSINKFINLFLELKKAGDQKIQYEIDKMISYDLGVREFITKKTGAKYELEFLFGRPLIDILEVIKSANIKYLSEIIYN